MCKFCNNTISMTVMLYTERIESVDVWRLPQRQIKEIEKIPIVKATVKDGWTYKQFYKKPFLFCPYCGRKLLEKRKDD